MSTYHIMNIIHSYLLYIYNILCLCVKYALKQEIFTQLPFFGAGKGLDIQTDSNLKMDLLSTPQNI